MDRVLNPLKDSKLLRCKYLLSKTSGLLQRIKQTYKQIYHKVKNKRLEINKIITFQFKNKMDEWEATSFKLYLWN